jgi:hypothetical protein
MPRIASHGCARAAAVSTIRGSALGPMTIGTIPVPGYVIDGSELAHVSTERDVVTTSSTARHPCSRCALAAYTFQLARLRGSVRSCTSTIATATLRPSFRRTNTTSARSGVSRVGLVDSVESVTSS